MPKVLADDSFPKTATDSVAAFGVIPGTGMPEETIAPTATFLSTASPCSTESIWKPRLL
jgi:hypothetical protein